MTIARVAIVAAAFCVSARCDFTSLRAKEPEPAPPPADTGESTVSSPYDVGSRAQLFVDQFLVRESDGVSFVQHSGKKHASNPLLTADQPWEGWRLELFGSVIYDDDEKMFKMWYFGESNEDFPSFATYCATSEDGIRWTKPRLDVVPTPRYGNTNAVTNGYILANVIKDKPEPDAQRRYKMIC